MHLLGLRRLHRHCDCQPALARASGAETEGDDVVADGIDVALLAGGLGPDGLALRPAHDVVGEDLAGSLVVTHHVDAAANAGFVEVLPALQDDHELLAQPTDDAGLRAIDVDLVAPHRHVDIGIGSLDEPQMGIALPDERSHEMRAGDDDGVRLRRRCHSEGPDAGLIQHHGIEPATVPGA